RCEMCGVKFDKGVGRRRQFCSDACRKAASRTAKRTTQVSSPVQSRNGLKNTDTSVTCKPRNSHLHPRGFSIPLDLLGKGHRWAGAPRLDRATWEKILWREACKP